MTASNVQILRTLIAKDWRLFRVPMVALIIVGAGCYLLAAAVIVDNWQTFAPQAGNINVTAQRATAAMEIVASSAVGALLLTSLLASALGGIAIAGERADRTADFLALLPVTRMQIVLSKLLSCALMLGLFAALHALVHLNFSYFATRPAHFDWDMAAACIMWLGCTISLLGISWLFSTFLTSGPISACIAIGVTAVTIALSTFLVETGRTHRMPDWQMFLILSGATYGVGLPCLVGGSLYYLRRVVP